jgi:hypothetical protein
MKWHNNPQESPLMLKSIALKKMTPLLQEKLKPWLESLGFDYGFMENSSGVYVVLPEVIIQKGMDILLKPEDGLTINHLECHADGVHLIISSSQALVSSVNFPVVLRCLENPGKQSVQVAYQAKSPVATNAIGKIVAFFGQSILTALLHNKIAQHSAVLETTIDEANHVVMLDLSTIEAIRKLNEFTLPIPSFIPFIADGLFNVGIHNLITLEMIHEEGGLKLVGRWDIKT